MDLEAVRQVLVVAHVHLLEVAAAVAVAPAPLGLEALVAAGLHQAVIPVMTVTTVRNKELPKERREAQLPSPQRSTLDV